MLSAAFRVAGSFFHTKRTNKKETNSCNLPAYKSGYPRHNERTVGCVTMGIRKGGEKLKKKNCYIYIVVSTAMQVDGYSLEAQKERLTKFAAFQEMEVVQEYCDAGKSGKSITGRPEFTRMLQDVAESEEDIDFILVFKLSRFGRNAADVLNSLQYIQDYGVNLICVEDGIDSSKDSGKLTITVLSAVAEIERENILVQTMEGRKQKAREDKWIFWILIHYMRG